MDDKCFMIECVMNDDARYDPGPDIPKAISPEQAVELLRVIAEMTDTEGAMGRANEVLCAVLRGFGAHVVIEAWDDVPRW